MTISKTRRLVIVAAATMCIFFAAPAAYAVDPVGTAQSIKTVGFENGSDTLATDAIIIAGQQDPYSIWGPLTVTKRTGSYGLWCGGELYPSGAVSTKFPNYTFYNRETVPYHWEYSRGSAAMALPELARLLRVEFRLLLHPALPRIRRLALVHRALERRCRPGHVPAGSTVVAAHERVDEVGCLPALKRRQRCPALAHRGDRGLPLLRLHRGRSRYPQARTGRHARRYLGIRLQVRPAAFLCSEPRRIDRLADLGSSVPFDGRHVHRGAYDRLQCLAALGQAARSLRRAHLRRRCCANTAVGYTDSASLAPGTIHEYVLQTTDAGQTGYSRLVSDQVLVPGPSVSDDDANV